MIVNIRVEWYPKRADNPFDWSATPIDITMHALPRTLRIRKTIKRRQRSSFSIDFYNPKQSLYDPSLPNNGFIAIGDKIMIYRWVGNREYMTTDLLFDGIVTRMEIDRDTDNSRIRVTGTSFSSAAFGSPVSMIYGGENYNSVTLTQELINRVNLYRSQAPGYSKLYWYPGNPTTRTDGSDFPVLQNYSWTYKSFTEVMDEIWSSAMTGDGDYVWYIKKDVESDKYYLYVEPMTTSVPSGNYLSENSGEIEIRGGYDDTNIANCIIYNYGRDNKGNVLQKPYYYWASIMRYGPRWRYITLDSESFDALLLQEASLQPDRFVWTSDNRLKERYPDPLDSSNPFTFSWGTTVTSRDEFNDELVRVASEKAERKVELLARIMGFARPTISFKYPASYKSLGLGDLFIVNAPTRGIFNEKLRIYSVEHDYLTTTYELMSDSVTV